MRLGRENYVSRVTKLKSAYGKIAESIGGMGMSKIKLILRVSILFND